MYSQVLMVAIVPSARIEPADSPALTPGRKNGPEPRGGAGADSAAEGNWGTVAAHLQLKQLPLVPITNTGLSKIATRTAITTYERLFRDLALI